MKQDEAGFIVVDEYQNTTVPSIYALGDVAGKKLLTPGTVHVLSIILQCTVPFF